MAKPEVQTRKKNKNKNKPSEFLSGHVKLGCLLEVEGGWQQAARHPGLSSDSTFPSCPPKADSREAVEQDVIEGVPGEPVTGHRHEERVPKEHQAIVGVVVVPGWGALPQVDRKHDVLPGVFANSRPA